MARSNCRSREDYPSCRYSTLKAENAVRIDNATDLLDVFGVYNKNPYEENNAIRIDHTLIDGYLVLPRSSTATTVFVVGSKVPHGRLWRRVF